MHKVASKIKFDVLLGGGSAFMKNVVVTFSVPKSIYEWPLNKRPTPRTWDSYKKYLNFCVNLLRKIKKNFLKKIKDINDNKKFWKITKRFFSTKGLNTNKLRLIEENNLISEEYVRMCPC